MSDTPRTAALLTQHKAETQALDNRFPVGLVADRHEWREHSKRQVDELLAHARQLERELAAALKEKDGLELAYISLKQHVVDCGLEEFEPGLFRNKRAEKAERRTMYKACPKHQGLAWNFMATVAMPAVEVCPHCEQDKP